MDNDGTFPEDSQVLTPFPLSPEQERGDRGSWPWLTATVQQQVGPDEWELCVIALEAARLADGFPAPEGTPEEDLFHPVVFRDSSEIRPRDPSLEDMRAIFPEADDDPGPHEAKYLDQGPSCIVCGKEHNSDA